MNYQLIKLKKSLTIGSQDCKAILNCCLNLTTPLLINHWYPRLCSLRFNQSKMRLEIHIRCCYHKVCCLLRYLLSLVRHSYKVRWFRDKISLNKQERRQEVSLVIPRLWLICMIKIGSSCLISRVVISMMMSLTVGILRAS